MTDEECELYIDSAKNCGYFMQDWYPDIKTARKMIEKFTDNIFFLFWILYSPLSRELTEEERETRKDLNTEFNNRVEVL